MTLRKNALAFESGGHRSFQALGQRDEIGSGTRGSEPQIQKRPAAGGQQAASLVEVGGAKGWRGVRFQQRLAPVRVQVHVMPEDIVFRGDFHEYRPGGRRARNPASSPNGGV